MPLGLWLLAALTWLLLRVALLLGVYLHRALRTDYEAPLALVSQFWNPWLLGFLLLPLALFHARWLKSPVLGRFEDRLSLPARWSASFVQPVLGSAAAALLFTLGTLWDPVGTRQGGRVAVDEFHSKWEPTDKPFDTTWYGHLSGYNYACIYDYCSRYYTMSRLTSALTDAALAQVDVLMVKVPTERYGREEIEAVLRFVARGGGLLLIGEHTDVFGTGHNLNNIARRFGFRFRYDCLFGIPSFFDQYYTPSFVPHPVVQHLRGMDFATSCSIDPGTSPGRSIITSPGLKNSLADYHVSNYYPPAVDHATMRYGAFVQLWAARYGHGRVLAFTDSTIFSNFCTFEPGKAELMLGMLEWLNHRDRLGNPRPWLFLLGIPLLGWALWGLAKAPAAWLPCTAATALLWALGCLGVDWVHQHRLPPVLPQRPFTQITIDRTVCEGPLSKNGFIEGKTNGFGIFERWILRLGYFTRRESGPPACRGDLVVFLYPTRPAPAAYLDALTDYVKRGGRILVVDAPGNHGSTAPQLLTPFGLTERPRSGKGGQVTARQGLPSIPVDAAFEIVGGEPLGRLGETPVAATTRCGAGSVTVVGFGSRFTDAQMGVTGDVVPNDELKAVYEFEYAMLRAIVGDTWLPAASPAASAEARRRGAGPEPTGSAGGLALPGR
jgi:hypothetical protein